MTSATVETSEAPKPRDCPRPGGGRMLPRAHLSHEAHVLKPLAADVLEDGVHATKRAIVSLTRRIEEFADFKDEAVHRVKRQPLRAVGIALGSGLVLGLAAGWIGRRPERRA